MLESPDDIFCFQFCPTDPNIIAGGCINGQVHLGYIFQLFINLGRILLYILTGYFFELKGSIQQRKGMPIVCQSPYQELGYKNVVDMASGLKMSTG